MTKFDALSQCLSEIMTLKTRSTNVDHLTTTFGLAIQGLDWSKLGVIVLYAFILFIYFF